MSITIGIPFYNAEEYLLDSVKSILAQTHHEWELILIDDGSTDSSLEIARSIKDSRVRVISDGQNKKLAYRLNQIIELAKYDFIARMDADDIISPNRLAVQLQMFIENPQADIVSTGVASINSKGEVLGVRFAVNQPTITSERLINNQHNIVHASILVKKSWFQRNRYDENIARAQDYELWARAFSKNDLNVVFTPEVLYFYLEELNITKNKLVAAYKTGLFILSKYPKTFERNFTKKLKFFIKIAVVNALAAVNKLDILLERRNSQPVPEEIKGKVEAEIRQVKQYIVPLKR